MVKYIEFQEILPHPGSVVLIRNKRTQDVLGRIEWFKLWHQYVFIPQEGSIWSHDCMEDVRQFILGIPNAPRQTAARSDASLHADVGNPI